MSALANATLDEAAKAEKRESRRYQFENLDGWELTLDACPVSMTQVLDISSRGFRLSGIDPDFTFLVGQPIRVKLSRYGKVQFETLGHVVWCKPEGPFGKTMTCGLSLDDQEESVTNFWGTSGYSSMVPIIHSLENR